jgi:hypothetical protein
MPTYQQHACLSVFEPQVAVKVMQAMAFGDSGEVDLESFQHEVKVRRWNSSGEAPTPELGRIECQLTD